MTADVANAHFHIIPAAVLRDRRRDGHLVRCVDCGLPFVFVRSDLIGDGTVQPGDAEREVAATAAIEEALG